jgi:hypothetical protein
MNHKCNTDLAESHSYEWDGQVYTCEHLICTICKSGRVVNLTTHRVGSGSSGLTNKPIGENVE